MKKMILILTIAISLQSCGQEIDTYWKSENVTRVDKKPFRGITSAYMDMIAEMKIHLSKNNDSLYFSYPFGKKIKIDEFKSFTNCRIQSTGKLIDSIYDIRVEKENLTIKFYYEGTGEEDKRFSLNFVKIDKASYLTEVESLKAEKAKTLDRIKDVDLSSLDLIKTPDYLSDNSLLQKVNPIQLAEELTDHSDALQITSRTFSLSKNKNKISYKNSGIENTDKINKTVATINSIKFNNIGFTSDAKSNQAEAIVVSKKKMDNGEIMSLYNFISTTIRTAKVEQFGLPRLYAEGDSLGIHNFIAITWKTKGKVIKLAIEDIPDELWDKEIDNNVALKDNYTSKDIDKVVRHYIPLIGASEIKLFIVSENFDSILYSKENNPGSKSWGSMYDYTFKWRYLSEIF